ncbi:MULTISPECIES: alpha/beta hydrolase [unclassified Fusibacter]|uniref:alpha/beta hydrolase n=1 Tax=unclassified Fusibacter TaxID=2624464 RepID=UPI0010103255|nr:MULTISPECIES: alpha/beta hydrolase [unclassified Fusibacter]MCK8058377.1 alpha/beta hydrolase [Fusibacter sp. A2]NPE20960.1 alpha/beta hydrolase fold domain-containing protein [Fusibacter sp. A1]RXV63162.1 steryl acetyl hydrolase [Fusibacter sp. A1]
MKNKTKVIFNSMKAMHFKDTMKKKMLHPDRSAKPFLPKHFSKKHDTTVLEVEGCQAVTFGRPDSKTHILYFHGGGYLFEISTMHWRFVDKMTNHMNCKTTVIQYPLAPENTFEDTYRVVEAMYKQLTKDTEGEQIILMGDSAGASLAMGLTHKLVKEKNTPLPNQLIMFSPYLDMTLSTPGMADEEAYDHMLSMELLEHSAKVFAGGHPLQSELLSPLFGDLTKLPQTAVFYGTHELFYKDCLRLKEMTRHQNNFQFYEYKDMQHVWMLFPIEEQTQVLEDILEFIKKE